MKWQLENRPHPEQGYRACLGLLNLAKHYGEARLEAACRRALAIGSPQRKSIKSILEAKLDQHPDLFPAADTADPPSACPHTQRARGRLLPFHPVIRRHRTMLIQTTLDTLNRLKLYGMAAALVRATHPERRRQPRLRRAPGAARRSRSAPPRQPPATRLLQLAQLKHRNACVEDIDYRARRGLDRSQLASLASCDWIRHAQNLLIHGATGAGKTWLACALAQQACRQGLSALYMRAPRLFDELSVGHADGSFRKRLRAIAKVNVLLDR